MIQDAKIAIVGLGLMGGSLALALRGKCAALYGVDAHPATLKLALDKKMVDEANSDPSKLLPQADLVVLATPIPAILDFIEKLPSLIHASCIVLDLGSTKSEIVAAMNTLPERFEALGGHPICGKENGSLENADGNLYQNAPFVLTALSRTTPRARAAGEQIANAVGAKSVWMEPSTHDRILAFSSHLPFLMASMLILTAPDEILAVIGPGFRSAARLAGTPSSMMLGVLQTNRKNVLDALHDFQTQLSSIESALSSHDDPSLASILDTARARYHATNRPEKLYL